MSKDLSKNSNSLEALPRILKELGADALSRNVSPEERVHCARVQSKRLTAALHLYKGSIPKEEFRSLKRHIKKASRMLARRRDLDVIRKRLWSRTRHLSQKDQRAIKRWLHDRIPGAGLMPPGELQSAQSELSIALRQLPTLDAINALDLFDRGTKKAFLRARKVFRKAKKCEDAEDFHQWRVWTKRLFLQLQLAASMRLPFARLNLQKLDNLQDKLGDLHDLHVACEFLDAEKDGPRKAFKHLANRLKEDRIALERKVLKRGKKLFSSNRAALFQILKRDIEN